MIKLKGKFKNDFEIWLWNNYTPLARTYAEQMANPEMFFLPDICWMAVIEKFIGSSGLHIEKKNNINGYFARVHGHTTYRGQGAIKGSESPEICSMGIIRLASKLYNEKAENPELGDNYKFREFP